MFANVFFLYFSMEIWNRWYYLCDHGLAVHMPCSSGTAFDVRSRSCVHIAEVSGCLPKPKVKTPPPVSGRPTKTRKQQQQQRKKHGGGRKNLADADADADADIDADESVDDDDQD